MFWTNWAFISNPQSNFEGATRQFRNHPIYESLGFFHAAHKINEPQRRFTSTTNDGVTQSQLLNRYRVAESAFRTIQLYCNLIKCIHPDTYVACAVSIPVFAKCKGDRAVTKKSRPQLYTPGGGRGQGTKGRQVVGGETRSQKAEYSRWQVVGGKARITSLRFLEPDGLHRRPQIGPESRPNGRAGASPRRPGTGPSRTGSPRAGRSGNGRRGCGG